MTTVVENAYVITMDAGHREIASGSVVFDGNRITDVIDGKVDPAMADGAEIVDGRGCILTPGLVNTHHHLYQWLTRGLAADHTLFEWLTTLYPVWAGIDEKAVNVAATGALGWLALSGCTTSTDHHYVFPKEGGDMLAAEIIAAQTVGVRFHPTRGSMDLSEKDGGLPPDSVVETIDQIMSASADAIDRWHDPGFDAMVKIALAPCSPFSVTADLLRTSAELARERRVRLHTHLAETEDESAYTADRFGCTPIEYMETVGWLGPDVWFAHGVHFDDHAITTLATSGSSVAHCPSSNGRLGAGTARARDLLAAGVPVGLGVDGAASNESSRILEEAHQAVLMARATGGPTALTTRQALEMATLGGARALGCQDSIGSIESGKLADMVLWRRDGLGHAGIADPVAALVLGAVPPVERLWVNGKTVVRAGELTTIDAEATAAEVAAARDVLIAKAG